MTDEKTKPKGDMISQWTLLWIKDYEEHKLVL